MIRSIAIACVFGLLLGCNVPYSADWKSEQINRETELVELTGDALKKSRNVSPEAGLAACDAIIKEEPNFSFVHAIKSVIYSENDNFNYAHEEIDIAINMLESKKAMWSEVDEQWGSSRHSLPLYYKLKQYYSHDLSASQVEWLREQGYIR